jgi:hypothetical protein
MAQDIFIPKTILRPAEVEAGENFRKSELLLASSQANFMALNSDAKK